MHYQQRRTDRSPNVRKKRILLPTEQASPHRAGHYVGLHPEDTPTTTRADVRKHLNPQQPQASQVDAFEEEEFEEDDGAAFHITTITKRYDGIPMPDGILFPGNKRNYYVHTNLPPEGIPARAGASRTTEAPAYQPRMRKNPRRRFHWLFVVGVVFLVMLIGWVGLNAFGAWWQIHQNDSAYGRPRTYQTDAVVGHSDSTSHPTHFMVVNLNRHIIIVEIPGGDLSKSLIYSGPVLMGDGQDLTPATLTFQDMNNDGKLDMLVHILDQTLVFLNTGSKFVPQSQSSAFNGESNLPVQGG